MEDWAKKLDVGDKVIVRSGYVNGKVCTVTAITKTTICVDSGERFKKESLRLTPIENSLWGHRTTLAEANEKAISEIRIANKRRRLARAFYKIETKHLTIDQLERILLIATEITEAKK